MTPSRWLLAVLAVACLLLPSPSAEPPDKTDLADKERPTVPRVDTAKLRRKLEAVEEYIKSEDWRTSIMVAQELLDLPSDVFIEFPGKDADGKKVDMLVGVRLTANRLLAGMPQDGRDFYEAEYGKVAAKLLARARKESDMGLLFEVAQRYLNTKAGREAAEEVRKAAKEPPAKLMDWPMFGGTPSRDGQADGGAPFLQPFYRYSLFSPERGQVKRWISGDDASVVRRLENKGEAVIPTFTPVTATVTGRDGKPMALIIYRDYDGIAALLANSGKRYWISHSHWSMEGMLKDGQKGPSLTNWVSQFKDQHNKPGVLIENSTVGTMSSDGRRVYFIDDLQVPPFFMQQFDRWGGMPPPGNLGVNQWVKPGVDANKLQAISIADGKLFWELGGVGTGADDLAAKMKHNFRDSYFLGAPLPVDGKLYFLNEKDREIRLVCLDTGKLPVRDPQYKDLDAAITWVQPLGRAKEKMLTDYGRRINGAHLAYGEGVLVCPTNTGTLIGVDALTHDLLWAHTYVSDPDAIPGGVGPPPFRPVTMPANEWKASAPVVQSGKVVFALPDGPELRCLNLRDGRLLWSSKRRDDDVYLGGVIDGRVVVVGKKDVRALALADGKELWRVPTGMPSGRGAASGNVYYLPLKEGFGNTGPEVVAIDVAKGRAIAHTHARKDPRTGAVEVPGNIIFTDGMMIAQSATDLVAYPVLKAKLVLIEEVLKKDPKSPRGLFERGELRHEQGNLLGAVEDYRAVLANDPPAELRPRLRGRLFDVLTDLLQQDFGAGEKYLKEYEDLIRELADPKAAPAGDQEWEAEIFRRRAGLLGLKGHGFESQGKAVDALNAYLDLAALKDTGLLPRADDPAVKAAPAVWARARIAALYAGAKAPSRQLLDEEISKKGAALRQGKDIDALRGFVTLFGPAFAAGREAALDLAERLMTGNKIAQIDAEALLTNLATQTEDRQKAAQALEALARLMIGRGLLEDSLHYYQRLAREYPTTVIRDGKKGAEYLDGLSTDKRFLPYLEKSLPTGKLRWRGDLTIGKFPPQPRHLLYTLSPEGEVLPSLRQFRVAVNTSTNQFKLVERDTGQEKMNEPLNVNFQRLLADSRRPDPSGDEVRFGYHAVGHVLVVDVGAQVLAVDAINRRVLWERSLVGPRGAAAGANLRIDPHDGGLQMFFADGTVTQVAQLGPVTHRLVVLLTREGLSAVDLLTGRTLWVRSDVPAQAALFGDGERLFVAGRNADGLAADTRAFRILDGVPVTVPNFAAAYDHRLRIVGGEMLVKEDQAGISTLRLYDVATGKDLWSHTFPAGAVMMHSHDPDLAGVIDPTGRVTVMSVRQRKVVFGGIVNVDHMKNLKDAHLVADSELVFIMLDTRDPANAAQTVQSNLLAEAGLRGITVNGMVYAFERRTSKIRWVNELRNQQLVLEQWENLPVLLFTSRGKDRWPASIIAIEAFDKTVGKLFYKNPTRGEGPLSPSENGPIYAVNYDPQKETIELLASTYKLTITREGERPPAP